MRKLLFLLMLIASLSACALRPESISATYIPHEKYIDGSCEELDRQFSEAQVQLAKASALQNGKADEDTVGMFLILIPVSKFTGDYSADVAKWKGEMDAIEAARFKNKCK